ncbi:MAG: hypothetical protein LUH15_11000 [Tannerellaceae bacterium]|nr:hypothetical protein [Tannerellaceae bacterium]
MSEHKNQIYNRLRSLAGKDFTFSRLQEAIQLSDRRSWLLLETALFLHETAQYTHRPVRLERLHKLFFDSYGEEIEGFINELWKNLLPEKVWIPKGREKEFIEGVAGQIEKGVVVYLSMNGLARSIKRACRIEYSERTIENNLNERLN